MDFLLSFVEGPNLYYLLGLVLVLAVLALVARKAKSKGKSSPKTDALPTQESLVDKKVAALAAKAAKAAQKKAQAAAKAAQKRKGKQPPEAEPAPPDDGLPAVAPAVALAVAPAAPVSPAAAVVAAPQTGGVFRAVQLKAVQAVPGEAAPRSSASPLPPPAPPTPKPVEPPPAIKLAPQPPSPPQPVPPAQSKVKSLFGVKIGSTLRGVKPSEDADPPVSQAATATPADDLRLADPDVDQPSELTPALEPPDEQSGDLDKAAQAIESAAAAVWHSMAEPASVSPTAAPDVSEAFELDVTPRDESEPAQPAAFDVPAPPAAAAPVSSASLAPPAPPAPPAAAASPAATPTIQLVEEPPMTTLESRGGALQASCTQMTTTIQVDQTQLPRNLKPASSVAPVSGGAVTVQELDAVYEKNIFLTPLEIVYYKLLRSAFTQYLIFPKVASQAAVTIVSRNAEHRKVAENVLATTCLSFVVCDVKLNIKAVVEVLDENETPSNKERARDYILKKAGCLLVRFYSGDTPPDVESLRRLLLD
ncbi:MAG: DUF2726 domain-containing protein [Deltaproteobacteria bacterium]|jgi:hypothetical protein|nr:DUF2726 domain-containing protein [Deltaproteobacteria bacterium]